MRNYLKESARKETLAASIDNPEWMIEAIIPFEEPYIWKSTVEPLKILH